MGASLHEAAAVEHEDASAWRIEAVGDHDRGPPGLSPWPGKLFSHQVLAQQVCHRCAVCGRAWPRRLDGHVISHNANGSCCGRSGQPPAADLSVASWLPVLAGLTPHGLRHGHQTWMDEDRIADVLKSERMGHEVPGMRGVYSHVSAAMRAELTAALQERWTAHSVNDPGWRPAQSCLYWTFC